MPTTTVPTFTDDVSVLAATTIAFGGMTRSTTNLDLRAKAGAHLFAWLGRKGATALATGVTVEVRRVLANGSATVGGVSQTAVSWLSGVAASNATTVNVSSATSGTGSTFGVASATGIVAGDILCIYDASFTRLEFARVSKLASTTVTTDAPLQFSHTSGTADNVTRLAERFGPVFLPGGSLYEIVFDYGAASSGADVVALAKAQTYDYDTSTAS